MVNGEVIVMTCKRITQKISACVYPDGSGKYMAVLRRKRGKGYLIHEKELGLTKKQANNYVSKWVKSVKADVKKRKKRRTPYP